MRTLYKVQILTLICLVIFSIYTINVSPDPKKSVAYTSLSKSAQKEMICLADNIYFEARNEPVEGMYGVAFVTMNRVRDGNYPDTICDVVKQKINQVCQFSWWCETIPKYTSQSGLLTKSSNEKYNEILRLSIHFYANYEHLNDPTKGALFYHADYVNPGWKNVKRTVKIGRHIFYQDKGKRNEYSS